MNDEANRQELLNDYLLGDLDEAGAERVEAQCFAEPVWLDELLLARDDLLDAWARGELTPAEAAKLNARLQALPALRERAAFARSLQESLRQPAAAADPPSAANVLPFIPRSGQAGRARGFGMPRWSLAAAALLLLALGLWFGLRTARWRAAQPPEQAQTLTPLPKTAPTVAVTATPAPVKPKSNSSPRTAAVASFVLAAALVRGAADAPELTVPASARTLQLQLELGAPDAQPQRALLLDAAGATVWQQAELRPRTYRAMRFVICEAPLARLAEGAYQLRLEQAGTAATVYHFRLKKS